MSIESEARGIRQRHERIRQAEIPWCGTCSQSWPCRDRLAADAITQAADEAAEKMAAIRDRETENWNFTSEPGIQKCACYEDSRANIWDAVAALASLTGQEPA